MLKIVAGRGTALRATFRGGSAHLLGVLGCRWEDEIGNRGAEHLGVFSETDR